MCFQVFSKGPDDKVYNANKDLREKVARGNSVLYINDLESNTIEQDCIIFALRKFTGGMFQNCNVSLYSYKVFECKMWCLNGSCDFWNFFDLRQPQQPRKKSVKIQRCFSSFFVQISIGFLLILSLYDPIFAENNSNMFGFFSLF